VQALAQEILRRGAAARAVAALAGQGVQRTEEETGARASREATQPGTMAPPLTPTRTTGAAAAATGAPTTSSGRHVTGGPAGFALLAIATRPEPRRPQGLRPTTGPTPVTRATSKVEFNAQMSRGDVAKALLQLLPNQFKEPPKVAAEFGEGYVAPAEGAERTIQGRFVERVLGNEDLDVRFSMDRKTAMHNLRGLWRRMRREDHER
jgi:hypothetical protein